MRDRERPVVIVAEVEPKCKAGNLIWRLAEGSVASSSVALPRRYADSRQLYIINSHKYANSTTAQRPGVGNARVRERKHSYTLANLPVSPTRICTFRLRQTNAISVYFTTQLRTGSILHESLLSGFNAPAIRPNCIVVREQMRNCFCFKWKVHSRCIYNRWYSGFETIRKYRRRCLRADSGIRKQISSR